MPEQNYDIDQDLKEAEAMVKVLDPYIYEDQLYRRVGGAGIFSRSNIPYMTLGAVLLRLRRLRTLEDQLSSAQEATLAQLEEQHDSIHQEWRVHYEKKLVKEAASRLDAMRMFFDECEQNPKLCASAYMPEALRRTIVQETLRAMTQMQVESADVNAKKAQIDQKLRGVVRSSEFIWSDLLQSVYPEDEYWWLYHRPPANG